MEKIRFESGLYKNASEVIRAMGCFEGLDLPRRPTEPRRAYQQPPAVRLFGEELTWLRERLQAAFDAHGKVPQYTLGQLDWPDLLISPSSDNG